MMHVNVARHLLLVGAFVPALAMAAPPVELDEAQLAAIGDASGLSVTELRDDPGAITAREADLTGDGVADLGSLLLFCPCPRSVKSGTMPTVSGRTYWWTESTSFAVFFA